MANIIFTKMTVQGLIEELSKHDKDMLIAVEDYSEGTGTEYLFVRREEPNEYYGNDFPHVVIMGQ